MIVREDIKKFLLLVSDIMEIQKENIWIHTDRSADVVYINFRRPCNSDDSELTDEDIIIRYKEGEVVGLTVFHASKRA